jgi:hypothetical protein
MAIATAIVIVVTLMEGMITEGIVTVGIAMVRSTTTSTNMSTVTQTARCSRVQVMIAKMKCTMLMDTNIATPILVILMSMTTLILTVMNIARTMTMNVTTIITTSCIHIRNPTLLHKTTLILIRTRPTTLGPCKAAITMNIPHVVHPRSIPS